jgi:hypothetical protein
MIILTEKDTHISWRKEADGTPVFLNWDNLIVDNTDVVYGRTETNTTVYTGVTDTPADWDGEKYKYDGTTWSANSDYNEPTREFLESLGDPQPPAL